MSRLFPSGSRLELIGRSVGRLAGAWRGLPAICLGNGESRMGLDLGALPDRGRAIVIGCNRIYEALSHRLDCLVSMDEAMSIECMSEARIHGPLVLRGGVLRKFNRQHLPGGTWAIGIPATVIDYVTASSGVMSIAVAMAAGCGPIYCVGHDLEPGQSTYQGSPNYPVSNEPSVWKIQRWTKQLASLVREWDGHLFQVETENVPGAERISWDEFLDRFAGERVRVRK